jgi:hypothetical protein
MLLLISSKYSYFNPFFNYIEKGLKRTLKRDFHLSKLWHPSMFSPLDAHLFQCFDGTKVVMAQDVEWICCSLGGQNFLKTRVFLLPIQQMVAWGNLPTSSILFLDDLFFHFFSKIFLLISLLLLQLEIEVLKLFNAIVSDFSLVVKKSWIWFIFLHIYNSGS